MATQFVADVPLSDPVEFHQIIRRSPFNSPPLPPPTHTLDDVLQSSSVSAETDIRNLSNSDNFPPCPDGSPVHQSDSDLECREAEEGQGPLPSSPLSTIPVRPSPYFSRWYSPWSSVRDNKPLALNSSERWSLVEDAKHSEPPLYDEWPQSDETETKPSTVSSAEIKPPTVGGGLANLGNTCFLNAVLQCFTHTVPFVEGLRSWDHMMPCKDNSEGFCVLCALRGHVELSLASTGRIVFPWKLVENLSYFSSGFRRYQQEDAHEFLQCLLDRLDSCCINSKTKDNYLSAEDDNFVKQVFGGRLISKLQCCNCGHCSDTYEPLIDLSLEIEDVESLPSALQSFTKVEKIEDSDIKFTCENCNQKVAVEKQLMLDHAPSVAAFHLKRFKNDGSYVEKIDKYVQFPLELDLLPYTNSIHNANVDLKYDLYAIVVHIGFSSTSGHYYCFIRSGPHTWYRLDDSKVTSVPEDFVLSQDAYILFYAKHGTPWFSSFMETQKPFLDRNIYDNSPKSVLDNVDHNCMLSPSIANNHNYEVSETTDAADGICTVSTEPRYGESGINEAKDDSHRMHNQGPAGASYSCNGTLEVERMCNLEEATPKVFKEITNNASMTPQTPPRSPSPDIYKEDPPEVIYSIPRSHLKSENKASCKRALNKDLENYKGKQLLRHLKNMPNSRKSKFLDALNGSYSESSLSKRSRRI